MIKFITADNSHMPGLSLALSKTENISQKDSE